MDTKTMSASMVTMDPVFLTRTFFVMGAATILLILAVPAFRIRFFTYGARGENTTKKDDPVQGSSIVHGDNATHAIGRFLDHLATYSVPHSWFLHFYAFSVALSLFWAYQITTHGYFFLTLTDWTLDKNSFMTSEQTIIVWWCLLIQGCRRLVECIQGPDSPSRMWIVHWFIGMVYYAVANIAIWIEGSKSLLFDQPSLQTFLQAPFKIADVLDIRLAIGLVIFATGAVAQNRAHAYLWALRKTGTYTFPTHPLFSLTLTPHYFSECVEYVGLMIVAAPPGQYVNKTIASVLVFVVVNLGVTANGTYGWYAQHFGQDKVKGKARMIPLIW